MNTFVKRWLEGHYAVGDEFDTHQAVDRMLDDIPKQTPSHTGLGQMIQRSGRYAHIGDVVVNVPYKHTVRRWRRVA